MKAFLYCSSSDKEYVSRDSQAPRRASLHRYNQRLMVLTRFELATVRDFCPSRRSTYSTR